MRNWPAIVLAALVILGCALLVAGVVRSVTSSTDTPSFDQKVARQLAFVRRLFGPWDTGVPPHGTIALLHCDGSSETSSWKFPLTPALPAASPVWLVGIQRQTRGFFGMRFAGCPGFGMRFWRPWIYDRDPWHVYVVRRVGAHGYRVVVAQISNVRRTGHRVV